MKTITTLVLPMIVALTTSAWAAEPEFRTKDDNDPRFKAALLKNRAPKHQTFGPRWVAPESAREEFAKDAKLVSLRVRLESHVDGGLVISLATVKSKTTISGDPVPAGAVMPARVLRMYRLHRSAGVSLTKLTSYFGKDVQLEIKQDKNGVPFVMKMSLAK